MHAAWTLYGRPKGLPCLCTPCMEGETGEVSMRILVQGREPESRDAAQLRVRNESQQTAWCPVAVVDFEVVE